MKQVWIIGSGKLGVRAARFFFGRGDVSIEVTLVDRDRQCLEKATSLGCATVAGGGGIFAGRPV